MEQRMAVQSKGAVSHFRVPNCFLYRDERTQIGGRFLLDTSLSSSQFLANSTRHSVTSRIAPNSRPLSYLIFSTRHLNATLENRKNVEKFNTRLRFFAASDPLAKLAIALRGDLFAIRQASFPYALPHPRVCPCTTPYKV